MKINNSFLHSLMGSFGRRSKKSGPWRALAHSLVHERTSWAARPRENVIIVWWMDWRTQKWRFCSDSVPRVVNRNSRKRIREEKRPDTGSLTAPKIIPRKVDIFLLETLSSSFVRYCFQRWAGFARLWRIDGITDARVSAHSANLLLTRRGRLSSWKRDPTFSGTWKAKKILASTRLISLRLQHLHWFWVIFCRAKLTHTSSYDLDRFRS